jgi:hypothetical protein
VRRGANLDGWPSCRTRRCDLKAAGIALAEAFQLGLNFGRSVCTRDHCIPQSAWRCALSSARWHRNRWSDIADQRLNRHPRLTRSGRLQEPESQNSGLSGRNSQLSFKGWVAAL